MPSRVTQRVEFECCYLLETELNAHRYRFDVTVESDGPRRDKRYIISFQELTDCMKKVVPDKSFLFDTTTYNVGKDIAFILGSKGVKISGCPYMLSAENICSAASQDLQRLLDDKFPGVKIVSSSLKETTGSFVSWRPNVKITAN